VRLDTSRELRETLKFAADVLEPIDNAEPIRALPQRVFDELRGETPELARRVRETGSELVRARLLGL